MASNPKTIKKVAIFLDLLFLFVSAYVLARGIFSFSFVDVLLGGTISWLMFNAFREDVKDLEKL